MTVQLTWSPFISERFSEASCQNRQEVRPVDGRAEKHWLSKTERERESSEAELRHLPGRSSVPGRPDGGLCGSGPGLVCCPGVGCQVPVRSPPRPSSAQY